MDVIKAFFKSLLHGLMQFVLAFSVGTGASAIVCWYFNIPLAFSLIGGFIVLGIALAVTSDSIFD